MRGRITLGLVLALGAAIGITGVETLHAQQGGIKRTILERHDLAGVPGKEVIVGTAEIAPGSQSGRHLHHGDENGYVLAGTLTLEIDGQAPQELKPGMAYHIGAERVHNGIAQGSAAKVLAIYIVDKGKPLAEPAPK